AGSRASRRTRGLRPWVSSRSTRTGPRPYRPGSCRSTTSGGRRGSTSWTRARSSASRSSRWGAERPARALARVMEPRPPARRLLLRLDRREALHRVEVLLDHPDDHVARRAALVHHADDLAHGIERDRLR